MRASICTFTGVEFFPLMPRVEDIRIADIAHALSCMPRFAGHTRSFYSVAQHCVLVSRLVPKHWALYGLLHDSAEAYLMDLPTPIKRLFPAYERAEQRLLGVIGQCFGLPELWQHAAPIKQADALALRIEQYHLMPEVSWWTREPIPAEHARMFEPLRPDHAEDAFLAAFEDLTS